MGKVLLYRVVRLLILLGILTFSFVTLASIFTAKRDKLPWNATSKIKGFYELEENSLDVVFLGSSHAFCTFNPAVFYKQQGIKSYVFASNEQPLWLTYHYFKEVLKTQNPKTVVLELFYVSENKEYKRDGVNKINLDDLPFSINKILAQKAAYKDNIEGANPFYNYHDRWKNLELSDFQNKDYGLLKGFTPLYKTTPKTIDNYDVKPSALPSKNKTYLKKIIELAKENDIELVFTYAPYYISSRHAQHIKTLEKIADSINIKFINYTDTTLLNNISFNPSIHFEGGHTNVEGAERVSSHLASFLNESNEFSHSESLEDYELLSSRFSARDSLKNIKDYDSYIKYLSHLDVYVAVSVKDALNRNVKVALEKLGSKINFENKFRTSFTGLYNKHRGYVSEKFDTSLIINKFPPEGNRSFYARIESASYKKGNTSKIFINNVNHLKGFDYRGFNFVIYDAVTNQVIDVANFDTFQNGNWKRKG